jgi:hypothetical protein
VVSKQGIPSIADLAGEASGANRKKRLSQLMENPVKNPMDFWKNQEAKQFKELSEQSLQPLRASLKATVGRYLTNLEAQQSSKILAAQVSLQKE